MKGHHLLLGFGVLSLGVSLSLTVLILATAIALLGGYASPQARDVATVLGFTCVASGLCCAVLSGLQFAQLAAQEHSKLDEQQREAQWSEALLAWAYLETPLPQRLDQAGAETLLKLRDTISGDCSDRLADLYAQEGWLAQDLNSLARRHLSIVVRAQIIERLALLRETRALDALSRELTHPHREIRALALLALSRSVGRLNLEHDDRQTRTLALHTAIIRGQFSVGQVQEALTLLGDAGYPLARNLLTTGTLALRVATLEVLSRQRSTALHDDVTELLHASQAELRAGALKVFVRSGHVPAEAADVVLGLTADPTSFVRLQATRAAAHLTPCPLERLWELMGDGQWWVRRAASQGLTQTPEGQDLLRRARSSHPDRFARDAAAEALSDSSEHTSTAVPSTVHVRTPWLAGQA